MKGRRKSEDRERVQQIGKEGVSERRVMHVCCRNGGGQRERQAGVEWLQKDGGVRMRANKEKGEGDVRREKRRK